MSSVAALWDLFDEDAEEEWVGTSFGSPPPGVKFLDGILTGAYIIVEAAFGADVNSAEPQLWNWTDITTDVRQADGGNVSITIGRSDESSQASPATCSFQLDNTSGNYTAFHPGAKYWPNLKRNTPIRVRLYVNGSYSTRFQGYANGWVPSWDESANLAIVTVSASGITRRLGQGKSPVKSPLNTTIVSGNPAAYWPLEDGSTASQAASGIIAGAPMTANGSPVFGVAGPPGSNTLANLKGASLSGMVSGAFSDSWRVEFALKYDSALSASANNITTIYTPGGDPVAWTIAANTAASGGLQLSRTRANGTISGPSTSSAAVDDGKWHWVRLDAQTTGSDVAWFLWLDNVTVAGGLVPSVTLGAVTLLLLNPGADSTQPPDLGHVVVWTPALISVDTRSAFNGFPSESTTGRFNRLCGENDIQAFQIGPRSTTTMGPQSVDTFINLQREVETTEDGLLVDGLGPGLTLVTRSERYNATAVLTPDMAADPPQVANPFAPADDDQRNRNLIKADRKNGSSATFEDSTDDLGTSNIGTYDSTVTVNIDSDSDLLSRASWEVHKGTAKGFRYPSLNLDLAATPAIVPYWLATQLSGRIDVLNVTSKATQHPPGTVSLLLEGYSETLSPFDWLVTANCSPYDPWRVAVIQGSGDTALRLDTDGSTLHASYAAGVTSIVVDVNSGAALWTTAAADFPMDLDVGGIQVTATAASGSSSPQTFTVNPTAYPLMIGSTVKLWRPAVIGL